MPGLVDNPQTPNVIAEDVTPLATGAPTASFDDFIRAYREGTITADDIRRRQTLGNLPNEAEKQQLLAGVEQNKAAQASGQQSQLDIAQVRPLQREQAVSQTTGAIQQSDWTNRINSPDPAVYKQAQQEASTKAISAGATQLFGTPTPDLYIIHPDQAQVKPEEFGDWVNRQVNSFQGSDKQRADYQNELEVRGGKDGKESEEYQAYVKSVKNRTMKLDQGTPEYQRELRRRVDEGLTHQQLEQINFDTLRELGKATVTAQAKAGAEGPTENQKKATELRKELETLKPIQGLAQADTQYKQVLLDEKTVNSKTPEEWRKNPDAARAFDLHLAFNYFKILHPETRVTESNFKEIKNLSPLDFNSKELYDIVNNLVTRRTTLDPEARQSLIRESKSAYQGYVDAAAPILQGYKSLARRQGIPEGDVILPHLEEAIQNAGKPVPPMGGTPPARPQVTSDQAAKTQTFNSLAEVPANVQYFKDPQGNVRQNPNFRP